jgi:hypothetical protein
VLNYDEWRDALFAHLVSRGTPERGLYLFVDRQDLAEASGIKDAHEALTSFTSAYCAAATRDYPFLNEYLLARAHDPESPDPPPYFLGLVMSVLAVTEEPLGASHGVYRRQNQLLGREPVASPPPGYTEHVPYLWQAWNQWLRHGGRRFGLPTARSHAHHWKHQGWARSQGLFRQQDRLLVQDWFEDRGIRPGDRIPRTQLLGGFLTWLKFRGRTGQSLVAKLADEAARDVLADLLESELSAWTGQVARTGGVRRPRGLLVYDEWGQSFALAWEPSRDLFGTTIRVGDEEIVLDASTGLITVPVEEGLNLLLGGGLNIPLSDGLVLRGGGEPLYLMTESVEAGGLLQERSPAIGMTYRLLVPDSGLGDVVGALDASGVQGYRTGQGPVPGWNWVGPVAFTRPVEEPHSAVLGTVSPVAPPLARLEGGLRVAEGRYLTGGAPDVLLQAAHDAVDIRLDGQPCRGLEPDTWVVHLPQEHLSPGTHTIAIGAKELTFSLEDGYAERPVASSLGHRLDKSDAWGAVFASTAQPVEPGGLAVRGALVDGRPSPPPPTLRVLPNTELLVVTDEGRTYEVTEPTPRWLVEASLPTSAVEIPDIVRGLEGMPAFVLRRNPRSGVIHATEVPAGMHVPPGRVRCRERSDLGHALVVEWRGLTASSSRRRSHVLTEVLRNPSRRPSTDVVPTRLGGVETLADEVDGTTPLDELLRWLSELERGTTSTERVRTTWGWLARRYRVSDGSDWRLALYYLQTLGHVEVDYERSRVGIAPPVANILRRGGGLAVLCGARPRSLVDTLNCGEAEDPVVEEALSHLVVHRRTPLDEHGKPAGPMALYLEWDPAHQEEVVAGLRMLGVEVTYATADALLGLLPGIEERLRRGLHFEEPPAKQALWRESVRSDWTPTRSTTARGLYRFSTRREAIFAWRESPWSPLIQIDRRLGPYLLLQSAAFTGKLSRPLLHRNMGRSSLLVARDAPLTPLLARAMVLRTGLLPRPVDGPSNTFGHRYLEYQNIDQQAAEKLAQLLHQPLGYI